MILEEYITRILSELDKCNWESVGFEINLDSNGRVVEYEANKIKFTVVQ